MKITKDYHPKDSQANSTTHMNNLVLSNKGRLLIHQVSKLRIVSLGLQYVFTAGRAWLSIQPDTAMTLDMFRRNVQHQAQPGSHTHSWSA